MPKISVVMPVYNGEKYLKAAIDSIFLQSFGDFEFIIINDCSKDTTEDIILSYDDKRIKYLKNDVNLGVAATLNEGIEVSEGEFIARMDADDISLPERFEVQLKKMQEGFDVCGGRVSLFENDAIIRDAFYPCDNDKIKASLFVNSPFAHPSVMIRKSILIENNLRYNVKYEKAEDYKLWCDMAPYARFCNTEQAILKYRIHASQVTRVNKTDTFTASENIRSELIKSIIPDISQNLCSLYNRVIENEVNDKHTLCCFFEIADDLVEKSKRCKGVNTVQLKEVLRSLFIDKLVASKVKPDYSFKKLIGLKPFIYLHLKWRKTK